MVIIIATNVQLVAIPMVPIHAHVKLDTVGMDLSATV